MRATKENPLERTSGSEVPAVIPSCHYAHAGDARKRKLKANKGVKIKLYFFVLGANDAKKNTWANKRSQCWRIYVNSEIHARKTEIHLIWNSLPGTAPVPRYYPGTTRVPRYPRYYPGRVARV